ncbi:hypothetical protein [Natronospira bacteriovora]|uniref:Uncharacterized protein n=1 Tax=Natronospira bacteriovora TaxID=3069753 RepID=A0ABU0WA24_9GAMM|nr:hypothetical protein [Natronospira sp. AB-CW4]MDQ2070880.1 hypothetical protein [Natronospira sp. AB-CW4]
MPVSPPASSPLSRALLTALLGSSLTLSACTALDVLSDPAGTAERAARDAASEAVSEAAREAGREVGRAVGEAIVRHYTPQFMSWYASYLSQLAFHAQGYTVESETRGYQSGEYSEWQVRDAHGDAPMSRMRRAYLGNDANGNERWQVVYHDAAGDDTIIMETVFTPGREQALRIFARFPDDKEVHEIEATDRTFAAPTKLKLSEVEGARESRERISVPAGDFEAHRISVGEEDWQQDWWLNDRVPGGVVRYGWQSRGGDEAPEQAEGIATDAYILELTDFGTGARSRLERG